MMGKKLVTGILVLSAISFIAIGPAFAVITGSAHDFKSRSWNTTGEICIVCHTPHSANSTLIPLWNHATTAATFTLYSSPSLNATVAQPDGSSKACLSCHDGTVAYNYFGSVAPVTPKFIGPTRRVYIGTDLSNDHPVSFTYNAGLATADGGLYDPTIATTFDGKTIDAAMLINHKLECVSCHDVHRNKGASAGTENLLLVDNAGSALCLTCHNK
jgi:predicted CXXCH cytochrome family protein